MSAIMTSRGRVLTRQQVRMSEAPIRLSSPSPCLQGESGVSVKTDPETGDVMELVIRCNCGEVTVVKCDYANASEES
jgi:hypothetical protein